MRCNLGMHVCASGPGHLNVGVIITGSAHSVVYHHYKFAKEYAVQPWDACVCVRTRAPYCKSKDTGATCSDVDGIKGWRGCLWRIPSFTRPRE